MYPIALLHCIITDIENRRLLNKIYLWKTKKDTCIEFKLRRLVYNYNLLLKQNRPLGAFIIKWSEKSPIILEEYGYCTNGIKKKYYKTQFVNVIKFKTLHRKSDEFNIRRTVDINFSSSEYDLKTFHHLDFYLDKNNKLLNTDVYTSIEN